MHLCHSALCFLQGNMTAAKEVYGAWEDTWHTQKPGDTRSSLVLCQRVCTMLLQLCAQGCLSNLLAKPCSKL